jgi:hypothetical protein
MRSTRGKRKRSGALIGASDAGSESENASSRKWFRRDPDSRGIVKIFQGS